jgi:hypothetical protein
MKKIISIALIALFSVSAMAADKKKKSTNAPKSAPAKRIERETIGGLDNTNRGSFSREYGMAGCGLGSQVMGKRDGQIFAATLNGTGMQTIGITIGTSNCMDSPTAAKADSMDKFIVANQVKLADDIARGNGETLAGLAQVMNCKNAENLGTALQSNFSTIFSSHELAPNEITDNIITVLGRDSSLAQACSIVI